MSYRDYFQETSMIWAALNEHQDHPGSISDLYDHVADVYGVRPVDTITYDQDGRETHNLMGYEVVDARKHNLFVIKYQ